MERIEHFSHPHWLTECEIKDHDEEVKCFVCAEPCLNQSYGCDLCRFFIHKKCAKLPTEIRTHPLHIDDHPLTLGPTAYYVGRVSCDACNKRCRGFTFRCEECDFDLDIDCALMFMSPRVKDQLEHFSHEHPLVLEEVIVEDIEARCEACGKRCWRDTYTCSLCKSFFLHSSCAKLKTELRHWLHEQHNLELRPSRKVYDGRAWCDLCGKMVRGFVYHCETCEFDLDVKCSQQRRPTSEPGVQEQEINHFSHRHLLTLVVEEEGKKDGIVTCFACGEDCSSSQMYGCKECGHALHESCLKLPTEANHPHHESHPLKLQVAAHNYCDFCGETIKGFVYCCDQCDFNLDMRCFRMSSISPERKNKVEETKVKNFAHVHELTGSMKRKEDKLACSACDKRCTGLTYACGDCGFYLHKGCAELPQEYKHFFHPRHELNLQSNDDSEVVCGACQKECHGFTFSCNKCKLHLDVGCAMMAERTNHGVGDHKRHLSHGHPLRRTKKELEGYCLVCNKPRSDPEEIYVCDNCSVWLHSSCSEIPQSVRHFFHDFKCDRELTLEARIALEGGQAKLKCGACSQECHLSGSVFYHCEHCSLILDVECALMPYKMPEGAETKLFPVVHGHPLQLCSRTEDTKPRVCSVCRKPCDGCTYQCTACEVFFVHELCTELPHRIRKPYHQKHQLELIKSGRCMCAACGKSSSCSFYYFCNICSPPFSLHIDCMKFEQIIKYDDHGHYLGFFDNIHKKVTCRTCHGEILPCSSEEMEVETENKQGLFRCAGCDYSLHLLCGPLPCRIKSDNHRHVLQLEDKFIEDNSGEYYCDACEKKRDPEKCVYKCSEEKCPYVAHFECMKPEVIRLLKGEQRGVKLRTLGPKRIDGEVMSKVQDTPENEEPDGVPETREPSIEHGWILENLLDVFVEDKQIKLEGTFQILRKEMMGTGHASVWERLEKGCSIARVSPYSRQTFSQFRDRIKHSKENLEFSTVFFENEELVKVEGYTVVRSLAPILEQLLQKHRDISIGSELKLESKSVIFNLLCGAISSMSTTRVDELSETLLHDWWNQFMMAEHAGFKIQFGLDHLDEIAQAHFALRAEEIQNHMLKELEDQIGACHVFLKDQAAKAKELTRLSEQYKESAEASLREELWGKAMALEGKTVGGGLL